MGGGLQIHCFEPGAHTFALLSDNDFAKASNVFLNNIGLGRSRAEMTLYYDKKGSGIASLTKRDLAFRDIDFKESERVQIQTLDEYAKARNIKHISLLKVDVEGHELDVFAGAKELFAQKAIDMITFEFGGCNIDTRTFFKDFWLFFEAQDMALYRFLPNKKLFSIGNYKEHLHEQFSTSNYLAISKSISVKEFLV